MQGVATQLLRSFADCLERELAAAPEEGRAPVAPEPRPVSGLSLGAAALRSTLMRLLRRLVGRRS